MSNVIPLHSEAPTTGRELVAAEVRAELARQRQNSNSLPKHLGKSQRYWYERINARLAFSVDDLAALSALLRVPMSNFVPNVVAPGPEGDSTAGTDGENRALRPVAFLADFRASKASQTVAS